MADEASTAINNDDLPAKPDKGKVRLELIRAYWPEEDKRISEGTIFDCDAVAAVDLVESGVAKRAK